MTTQRETAGPQGEQAVSARPAVHDTQRPVAGWPGLHRRLGNAGMLRLLQARLSVSQPDDPQEQEAERVADALVRVPAPSGAGPAPQVQRLGPACEQEPERRREAPAGDAPRCQAATGGPALARQAGPEDEEAGVVARQGTGIGVDGAVTPAVEAALGQLAGRGRPLPEPVRNDLEPRFGADFGTVRIHTDGAAQALARAVNAEAFTLGTEVVFGAGRYAPETPAGRHLLAHELTHVLQQGQGGVQARRQRDPGPAPGTDRVGDCATPPAVPQLRLALGVQQTPLLSRRPGAGTCRTGLTPGSAHEYPDDRTWPSGAYVIWGPLFAGQDPATYADQSLAAWIPWRFGVVSAAMAQRIRAEAALLRWDWHGDPLHTGCQYTTRIAREQMNHLVALAGRDPAARRAESREAAAGLPALPAPAPIPDQALEVTVGGGGAPRPEPRPQDPRAAAERALDPTSVYEAGTAGATDPPFPARMDGPELEVPRGTGTYRMVLDYAAVTSEPLLQIAYHMSLVDYHWELYDITQLVRRGLGAGVAEETRALGQTMPVSPPAAAAAGGATAARAGHAADQLGEETQRAWVELRDPRRAAAGGSAVDVITRSIANTLNLRLLPASAIIAAGGQALGALADLMGAYAQEREIAFPNRGGFFLVRCIAQPAPRGPHHSERRAASVQTKIVEVRPPAFLAANALDQGAAEIAELELRKAMTSDPDELRRLDAAIAATRTRTSGDLVEYLEGLVAAKAQEVNVAQPWQRGRLERELELLQRRLEQARTHRAGTGEVHHRPQAAFTSLVTGDTYPLVLELNALALEQGFRVRLTDATVPDRPPIERNGATREQAVRNAFTELAFHSDLGRGQLVVRMPATWEGEPRTLATATGDANTALVRRRLQDLATALLVLSLAVPGLGEVSVVLGAALAVDRLLQRALNGTLRLDAESVADTLAILGAVAQGAQLVGRLRVVRAGRAFIAAERGGELAAIEQAATALDAAVRTRGVLDLSGMLTNLGGLIWGDLNAIAQLAQLQQDETEGLLTHAQARRHRAELLGAAIRDHGILLAGALRPTRPGPARGTPERAPGPPPARAPGTEPGAPLEARPGAEPGTRPSGPEPPRGAAPQPRPAETLPEAELEGRARQAATPATGSEPAPVREDGVRARLRTPDGLHEVFILNDGRVFRCSLTCAQMRTWYETWLRGQREGTRRQAATLLDGELAALEARSAAGENTPDLHRALATLDVRLREFIAPDLAAELQQGFQAAGRLPPGQRLLTTDQTRALLRVFNIDEIQVLAGPDGFRSPEGLRRLAEHPADFQQAFRGVLDAFPGDALALRGLTESLGQAGAREPALILAYRRAVQIRNARGVAVDGTLVHRLVRAATGPLMDANGQLTDAGIAFVRERFPTLTEGRRGRRGTRETPLSELSNERIRQQFAQEWPWHEALVLEEVRGHWLLRGETATDFVLANPNQTLHQVFARLVEAAAAEGTGRQTGGAILGEGVYPFVLERVAANDPVLKPAWDRIQAAVQDRRLPDLRRRCRDFLDMAPGEPFLLGEIGNKKPDVVEVMLSQDRVNVLDPTFAVDDPIHNFKTAFYVAVLQSLIGQVRVAGGDYRSVRRQTPVAP